MDVRLSTDSTRSSSFTVPSSYAYTRASGTQGITCAIYNMSGRVVSNIQTRAEGETFVFVENPRDTCRNDFRYENRTKSLCKWAEFCIRYTTTFLLCFLHELQYQWVLQVQYVTTSESCTNEFTSSVTKSPKRSSAKTHNSFKDMSSNQSSLADAICKKMYKKNRIKKKYLYFIFFHKATCNRDWGRQVISSSIYGSVYWATQTQWAPYIHMEWDLRVADGEKSEAKDGGHGDPKLRRSQSLCAIFTLRVNMKDRVLTDVSLAAMFGFTRWPEDLTPDIYRAHCTD